MSIPGNAMGAIKELVDNSLDASASRVWIILEPTRVIVQDDGHGMVNKMPDQDYQMLQLFKQELEAGNEPDDIRDLLNNPCAFASFTWAMECVGFSGKKRYLDPTKTLRAQQGMRGVGALSFNLIGDRQQWFSRPGPELARLYYGEETVRNGSIPISRLDPPTRADIRAHRLQYEMEVLTERFMRDPVDNSILTNGTRVEITELRPEMSRILTTENLAEGLKKLYGKFIREGVVKIIIVDLTCEPARVTEVEGTHYDGVLLLKATLSLKLNSRNKPPFRVEVYYNDRAVNSSPDLIRSGLAVNQITSLPEFRRVEPWSSGKLTGYVEFPTLPADSENKAWDAAKTSLQNSRERTLWAELISQQITPQLAKRICEIQSRARDNALATAFNQAKQAALEAMAEIPALKALNFMQPEPPTKPSKPTKPSIPDSVRVAVIDENNMGVPDVTVEFYRSSQLIIKRLTSLGGNTSFGKPGVGNYRIQLVLPPNSGYYPPAGKLDHSFRLTKPNEGFRMVFTIITGRKKPEGVKDKAEFQLGATTLDQEIPYSVESLPYGLLLINTEGVDFKNALDRSDEPFRDVLIAEYIAAGLTEWGLADYPMAQQHLIRCQYFAKVASSLVATNKRRRR